MRARRTMTATTVAGVIALAAASVAVAAGDPTPEEPPRIAFVANAFNPADALAVGPIAGQLGAPLCTTAPDGLSDGAATCLTGYGPELVLVAGGPGAIADGVLDQIRTATGLTGDDVDRVFGVGRTETAAALATVFADRGIDPAFLPVGATATDADLLDGLDSTAFQPAGDYVSPQDIVVRAPDGHIAINADSDAAGQPLLEFTAPSGGAALVDVAFTCTSSGTTSTRWFVDLFLDDEKVSSVEAIDMILTFGHDALTSPGASAAVSKAVTVTAGDHVLSYSRMRGSGDGSLDCDVHPRVVVLPAVEVDATPAAG